MNKITDLVQMAALMIRGQAKTMPTSSRCGLPLGVILNKITDLVQMAALMIRGQAKTMPTSSRLKIPQRLHYARNRQPSAPLIRHIIPKRYMSMRKRLKDIIAAVVILTVICIAMWNIGWLSSWKEIAFLYTLLWAEIVITIIIDVVKNRKQNK